MNMQFARLSVSLAAALLATDAVAQPGAGGPPAGTPSGQLTGTPSSMEPNDRAAMVDAQERAIAAQNGRANAGATRSGKDKSRPAKAAEIAANATIFDNKGVEVGYVKALSADGVVVATENGQVRVPVESFGINSKGLVLGTTKAKFDEMMAKANGG